MERTSEKTHKARKALPIDPAQAIYGVSVLLTFALIGQLTANFL